MSVQGVGSVQIPAAIRDQSVFLSITDVFDFLKIKNRPSSQMDSIAGFFVSQQAPYLIDKIHDQILYQGKLFKMPPEDMIRTENSLYLRSDYFGQIFDLACRFSFRNLSVTLSTRVELPIIRELRQTAMRTNLRHLKGEITADTIITRNYPLFRMGMADWAVVSTQNSQTPDDTRLYLALGSALAGGESTVAINYDKAIPFREREQFYQWRMVDNDAPGLRQIIAGKLFTQATSSIYYPVVGLQFTNTPTTSRRSFGTYSYSNYTEPGWTVELYVNNELVDYTTADASGFFRFNVPLVYGNSAIRFRYYGPWGEERTSAESIQIPFNFIPIHQLEYTGSVGIEEDSLNSRFARANANYGLSSRLTVGAGVEYLSSVSSGPVMPFLNASFRVSDHLAIAGEYTYGVRSRIIATYQSPSDLQLEINYTRYKEGQRAINNTYLEERKIAFAIPVRKKHFTAFSRLTLYQIILPSTKYTTLEELISGSFFGVSANFTTYGLITDLASPYFYSNLSLALRLPGKLLFTPQTQYEYARNRFFEIRAELGKYISSRGYLNVFYEKNYKVRFQSVGIGLRYDLSYAQAGSSFRRTNGMNSTVQSASGSIAYDDMVKHASFTNRSSVGRGGIIFLPYLDLNNNGVWDRDEPKVRGLKIRINNGRTEYNKDGTRIQVSELEAYAPYTVQLFPDFENITWHIHQQTLSVIIDPNQFKVVEIPVTVESEVSGFVYLVNTPTPNPNNPASQLTTPKPQGRILVLIYRDDRSLVDRTMTEADGSFNYTGLPPGSYTARLSSQQLDKLHMDGRPISIPFTITASKEGDQVTNLNFILHPLPGPVTGIQ